MEIEIIEHDFSVCKVADYTLVDFESAYCFIGKTDNENSLVCITKAVPANVIKRDDGWRAFRIRGVLDFSLIGVLSAISTLLAKNKIGIFAVSTYNTDYIFTKQEQYNRAIDLLVKSGYDIA